MALMRILIPLLSVLVVFVTAEFDYYQCPFGWEDEGDYCYRFVQDPVAISDARIGCLELGQATFLLSINSDFEHNFIVKQLNQNYDKGSRKRDWWTSGRRLGTVGNETDQYFWEGDGRPIESQYYWHNASVTNDKKKSRIIYNYNGTRWGWVLGRDTDLRPYICKISKEDIYYISDVRRGSDYGSNQTEIEKIPRGPKLTEQPRDMLFEVAVTEQPDDIRSTSVTFTCRANGYPAPIYRWYKERTDVVEPIDVIAEPRYSLVGGSLVISDASEQLNDVGNYWCEASNEFGGILSSRAKLEFGFLSDFSKDPRSDVRVSMHKEAIIDCSAPPPVPENSDVSYEWYQGDTSDRRFVRTDTKYYIFISWDGKLYFSEVYETDASLYRCKISRPGFQASSGSMSNDIKLVVDASSPGKYEPTILSGFPRVYPSNSKVNQDIRIECFAAGSSIPKLRYEWTRKDAYGNRIVLPATSSLEDHNRVLNIKHAQIYDAGTYVCTVTRDQGMSDSKEVNLHLAAEPFFMVELEDRFIDTGSDLKWRCEADGLPGPDYFWLKDGKQITSDDAKRITISQNVLTITVADAKLHNGMYQCAASNTYATKYSSAELRVIKIAPTFAKMPLQINQFATKRGNTTIMCRPEAAPKPDIKWYKDGLALNPGTTPDDHYYQMPNGNLFIKEVEERDAGVYKCEATNTEGKASSTGNLTVLESVTITIPPEIPSYGVHVNKTSVLHCIASYNPQLDVTYVWHQNDVLIDFEKIYRLSESNYRIWRDPHFKRGRGYYLGALYIMNAQPSQKGRYTCTVESTNGAKVSSSVDIPDILGPPFEPAGVFIIANSNTTTSVQIQFIPAGNNGGTITSYVIEAFNFDEGFWKIHETNVFPMNEVDQGIKRHTITNLRPFTTYQFRVRAENRYGTSKPSRPTGTIRMGAVKPDLYPEQIGGGGGKTGELSISWKPMKPWERNGNGFYYRVYWKPEGDAGTEKKYVNASGDASYLSILVGKDNYYMPYDVAVQACNEKGEGPISPQVTLRSAMRMPDIVAKNVQIQPFNATACIVTWEPVNVGREKVGGKLGGYRVAYWDRERYGKGVMEDASRVTINGQVAEAMVIGLEPDTVYMFGVYVWNEAGNGPISDPFAQRTLRQAPINQPVEVKVFQLSETSVHVFFRGVSTTNKEEPLTGYKIRLWHGGLNIKKAVDYDAKKEIDYVIRGLNPEILYKLRVYGFSRGGMGTMSSPAVEFKLGAAGHLKASGLVVLVMATITYLRTYL